MWPVSIPRRRGLTRLFIDEWNRHFRSRLAGLLYGAGQFVKGTGRFAAFSTGPEGSFGNRPSHAAAGRPIHGFLDLKPYCHNRPVN